MHSVPNNPSLKPQLTPEGFVNRHQGCTDGTKHTVLTTMAILCTWSQVVLWTTICSSNDPLPELHMVTKVWRGRRTSGSMHFLPFLVPFLCALHLEPCQGDPSQLLQPLVSSSDCLGSSVQGTSYLKLFCAWLQGCPRQM